MSAAAHITTSGGLISTVFIGAIREPGSHQREVEPAALAVGCTASALWAEAPKNPAALEETIAPPRFRLNDQAMIRAHVHSLVLETMGLKGVEKLPDQLRDLLNLNQGGLQKPGAWPSYSPATRWSSTVCTPSLSFARLELLNCTPSKSPRRKRQGFDQKASRSYQFVYRFLCTIASATL